jgi:hypothetical protein
MRCDAMQGEGEAEGERIKRSGGWGGGDVQSQGQKERILGCGVTVAHQPLTLGPFLKWSGCISAC